MVGRMRWFRLSLTRRVVWCCLWTAWLWCRVSVSAAQPGEPQGRAAAGTSEPSAEVRAGLGEVGGLESPPLPVLTLADALEFARLNHPTLRAAQAQTAAGEARIWAARSALLPQFDAAMSYQHTTDNYLEHVSTLARGFDVSQRSPRTQSFNYFQGGVSASVLVYDFGQSLGFLRVAKTQLQALEQDERRALLTLVVAVHEAFFGARATQALVAVAEENLANQERHVAQVRGFIEVGARPAIDLVQLQSERSNALVMLIRAKNASLAARAQLLQTIGRDDVTADDFVVGGEALEAVAGEEASLAELVEEATANRPELQALRHQVMAAQQNLRATQGGFLPRLRLGSSFETNVSDPEELLWIWSLNATLEIPLFDGALTVGRVGEARAAWQNAQAQFELAQQRVRVEVEQSRLAIREGLATVEAATVALRLARQRLELARGRYATGVGNGIELGDAQLALSRAAVQQVQVEYDLALARARLCAALGRMQVQ